MGYVTERKRRQRIAAALANQTSIDSPPPPLPSVPDAPIIQNIVTEEAEKPVLDAPIIPDIVTEEAEAPVLDFSKEQLTPPVKPSTATPTTPPLKKKGPKGNTAKIPQ